MFIYKRAGKRTELGLGGYGNGTAPVNLALARQKAEAIRQQLARGENPRAPELAPVLFAEPMEALITVREKEWRNARHADQWRMTLRETIRTSVTLFGDPTIRAGATFKYSGVRPELDGIEFIIETATHTLSKAGYTTAIEAKLGDDADEDSGSKTSGAKSSSGGDAVNWDSVAAGGEG